MEKLTDISDRIIKDDEDVNYIHLLRWFILIGNSVYLIIALIVLGYFYYAVKPLFVAFNSDDYAANFVLFFSILNVLPPAVCIIAAVLLKRNFYFGYICYACISTLFITGNFLFSDSLFLIKGLFYFSIVTTMVFIFSLTRLGSKKNLIFKTVSTDKLLDRE